MSDDQQLTSDPDKDPTKPSKVDHGEKPDWLQERHDAQQAVLSDPAGSTPAQMRPDNQPEDEELEERPLSGMDPQSAEQEDTEDPQVGGTLPPV